MFGYNDMNTKVPNPFITQGNILLSGAGRCPTCEKKLSPLLVPVRAVRSC